MSSTTHAQINQLHRVISDFSPILDRWNTACDHPAETTDSLDHIYADPSLLAVGKPKLIPGTRDLILDIGGTGTKYCIRSVSEDGQTVSWSEPVVIPNKSIQAQAESNNPDFLFEGYLNVVMQQIIQDLNIDPHVVIGLGVIWSNRMEPIDMDPIENEGLFGIGAIVPHDCEFSKGEFFTTDGKLQGKDISKIILEAAQKAGFDDICTIAISNDTVFTANAIPNDLSLEDLLKSVGGLIASTGTNTTILIESLLRNAECGVGLHIANDYLTDAEKTLIYDFENHTELLKTLGIYSWFKEFKNVYAFEDAPNVAGLRAQELTGGGFIPGWFALNLADQLGLIDNSSPQTSVDNFCKFSSKLTSKLVMDLAEGKSLDALDDLQLSESQISSVQQLANAFATRTTAIIAMLTIIAGRNPDLIKGQEHIQSVIVQDSQVLRGRKQFQQLLDDIVYCETYGDIRALPVKEVKVGESFVSVPSMGAANTLDILRANFLL